MTTLTLQPDETSGLDTWAASNSSTINHSTSTYIQCRGDINGNGWAGRHYFAWIKPHDFSGIPAGSTITAVTLELYCLEDNGAEDTISECLRDVVESEMDYDNYSSGNAWGTSGAVGAGDIGSQVVTPVTPSAGSTTTFTFNATGVALFQDILDGVKSNFGLLINHVTSHRQTQYASSSHATASQRPKFTITYTEPAGGNPYHAYAQQ